MPSESVEDYLKVIYKLQQGNEAVSTSSLAEGMLVSAPSATRMMQHIQTEGLALYTSHRGVVLTQKGRERAIQVIRRHRLIELFLVQIMGYEWDEIDDEAERLEHVVSERFERQLSVLLSEPAFCPHGDPIPDSSGHITDVRYAPLLEADPGQDVTVRRVSDREAERLRQIALLGLRPGTQLRVEALEADGVAVVMGDQLVLVPQDVARRVFVSKGCEDEQ